jgi:hypothetical protein
VGLQERVDRIVHRVALGAPVPQQREPAAGPEHAVDLGERGVAVEPVKGLRHRHEIHRRVVERDGLRGAVEDAGR